MVNKQILRHKSSNSEIRDLQLKSLEILLYFKDFCQEHNLMFYLCGGCCIGAIRHKGFIPWDDDVDVFMPREDYDKLENLWLQYADNERYSYCRTNKKESFETMLTQISDNYTTFIKTNLKDFDINHGIKLEIIPLDGVPNSKIKRKIQMMWAILFCLFNRQFPPQNKGKFANFIGKFLLSIFRTKHIRYKLWTFAEKQMTKYPINSETQYVTELCVTYKYMKNQYPKEFFEKAIYREFEGHKMPIPVGYDGYLHMAFGNYMELPPEKERVPKHDVVYINLKESYKKFKGIHYCVDTKKD